MSFGRGERIASLEARIEGVHQDIHMLAEQIGGVSRNVDSLRNEVNQSALARPSWAVVMILTFLSSLCFALIAAILGVVLV